MIFANSLDPDQARQNVGPDLDPNCFHTLMVLLKEIYFETYYKKCEKLPSMQRIYINPVWKYIGNAEKRMMYIEGSEWLPTLQNVKVDVSTQRIRFKDKKDILTLSILALTFLVVC